MVNRGAVMLRYKKAALDWINANDPYEDGGIATLEELNGERTVFLITDDDAESIDQWLEDNFLSLVDFELSGHFPDDDILPENFSLEEFHRWFDVEVHSVVVDTVEDLELFEDGDK